MKTACECRPGIDVAGIPNVEGTGNDGTAGENYFWSGQKYIWSGHMYFWRRLKDFWLRKKYF